MRWPLAHVRESVAWVSMALVLLLVAIVLLLTFPLWTTDLFGHLWH